MKVKGMNEISFFRGAHNAASYLCLVSFEMSLLLGDFCLLSWQTTWFQLNQLQIYKSQGQEIAQEVLTN